MSEAILPVCCVRSWLHQKRSSQPSASRSTRETFETYGIRMVESNREAASVGSMVVLTVKPQRLDQSA